MYHGTEMKSICLLSEIVDISQFGGKAANLSSVIRAGLPVPNGFAVGLDAFQDGKLTVHAKQLVTRLLDSSKLYAVRSSALAEDAEGASWAGQFETFLDTPTQDVIAKVEECHNSAKARAKAYATDKNVTNFQIAVVVQEMIKPDYAGVLFTKDPLSGQDRLVTEYVEGLGEQLVSGQTDPKRLTWTAQETPDAPFDAIKLAELAKQVEEVFGSPQDIEWASANGQMWLVQARPITATQTKDGGFYLGEPEDLFYWGPSRAKPMYMSDFMAAAEQFFIDTSNNPELPNPPKTLVLFHQDKMVWLSNAKAFSDFTEAIFVAYEKLYQEESDRQQWEAAIEKLKTADAPDLVEAWKHTIFAEFALYGAETAIAKQLERFDTDTRQDIWGAFTVPDNFTFLARMDKELLVTKDPDAMAKKYPWIEDGYNGVEATAKQYFTKRLKTLEENKDTGTEVKKDREQMAKKLGLTDLEQSALNLTRLLAEFMDERKAWMMQTRRNITMSAGKIEHGWLFDEGKSTLIDQQTTKELWERYIDFKASSSAISGIVASNGGRHFINGIVKVVSTPTDDVGDDLILVVPSTSPSYVPLMRKARALITDHGGMMSHAAIVAREFNLPCIVGTKQATKILKDGDKIVLDLVKGTVNL